MIGCPHSVVTICLITCLRGKTSRKYCHDAMMSCGSRGFASRFQQRCLLKASLQLVNSVRGSVEDFVQQESLSLWLVDSTLPLSREEVAALPGFLGLWAVLKLVIQCSKARLRGSFRVVDTDQVWHALLRYPMHRTHSRGDETSKKLQGQ